MTSAAKQQQQTRHKDNEKINKLYIIYYTKYRSYTTHEVWNNYFWVETYFETYDKHKSLARNAVNSAVLKIKNE